MFKHTARRLAEWGWKYCPTCNWPNRDDAWQCANCTAPLVGR